NVAVIYKKIELKPMVSHAMLPVLGNQEFLLAAMALLSVTSVGCLGLVAKARWQRSKIEKLQQQLLEHKPGEQLADARGAVKMARTS
ncbi:MAG TPA: hypothetical protein VM715_10275, partial [Candidatus Acidoferrum sp.]|nr:hypothetical protein [Candidatus Acidoferrum sp.]